MLKYIRIRGCDDTTCIKLEVTEEEFPAIERLVKASQMLGGGCMPTMHIDEDPDESEYER